MMAGQAPQFNPAPFMNVVGANQLLMPDPANLIAAVTGAIHRERELYPLS